MARAQADREEHRQGPMDDYRRRALDAVQQTLLMLRPEERLSFWRDKILPDTALAPIHHEARFKWLQQECVRPIESAFAGVLP